MKVNEILNKNYFSKVKSGFIHLNEKLYIYKKFKKVNYIFYVKLY